MVNSRIVSPSFKSKNCSSPCRVYSPRPKLNGYMQSITNQSAIGGVSVATGAAVCSMSPKNRQFFKEFEEDSIREEISGVNSRP